MNAKQLGDMHHAAVAVEELGGVISAEKVAERLKGFWAGHGSLGEDLPDVERAKTALLAAEEHRILEIEQ